MPKAKSIGEKTDKLDFFQIKNASTSKDNIKEMKGQATFWMKIFAKHIKDLLPEYIENFLQLNIKKTPQFTNGQKSWIDISPKKI